MNKLSATLLLAFALCLGSGSGVQAAAQEFGPGFSRFSIDVPEGWTATAVDGGVLLADAEKSCSLTVINIKSGGASAEALCKAQVQKYGMQDAKELGKEDGNYAMSGTKDGKPLAVAVTVDGQLAAVIAMGGDIDKASGPLDTLK